MVAVIIEQEEATARAHSYAIAQFAMTQVSSKARLTREHFMPYPDSAQQAKDGLQPQTARVMRQLIKARALPARVEAAAIRALGGMGDG